MTVVIIPVSSGGSTLTLHCIELQKLEIVGVENPCHAIVEALAKKLEELLASSDLNDEWLETEKKLQTMKRLVNMSL